MAGSASSCYIHAPQISPPDESVTTALTVACRCFRSSSTDASESDRLLLAVLLHDAAMCAAAVGNGLSHRTEDDTLLSYEFDRAHDAQLAAVGVDKTKNAIDNCRATRLLHRREVDSEPIARE